MKLIKGDIIFGKIDGQFYYIYEVLEHRYLVGRGIPNLPVTENGPKDKGEFYIEDFEKALARGEFLITGNVFNPGEKIDLSKSSVEIK